MTTKQNCCVALGAALIAVALFTRLGRLIVLILWDDPTSWTFYPGGVTAGAVLGYLIGRYIAPNFRKTGVVVSHSGFSGMLAGIWFVTAGYILYAVFLALTYHC